MKIVFNEGTEFNKVKLIYERTGELFVKTENATAEELKALFMDEELTCKITLVDEARGKTKEFLGYTIFNGFRIHADDTIEVINEKDGESTGERLAALESDMSNVKGGVESAATRLDGVEAENENQTTDIGDLNDAVAELGEIVGGAE